MIVYTVRNQKVNVIVGKGIKEACQMVLDMIANHNAAGYHDISVRINNLVYNMVLGGEPIKPLSYYVRMASDEADMDDNGRWPWYVGMLNPADYDDDHHGAYRILFKNGSIVVEDLLNNKRGKERYTEPREYYMLEQQIEYMALRGWRLQGSKLGQPGPKIVVLLKEGGK